MKTLIPSLLFLILIQACSKNSITEVPVVPDPVVSGDSARFIYVTGKSNGSAGTTFFAYDYFGTGKWQTPVPNSVGFFVSPAYSANELVVSANKVVSCVNAQTGIVKWSYTAPSMATAPKFKNDTVVLASSVIVPSPGNAIILLNKSTGAVIWSIPLTGMQPIVNPILTGNKIINLTTNATGTVFTLTSYDLATKNISWQKNLTSSFLMSAPSEMIVRNDTLIVGAPNNIIHVLNKNTGNIIWSKSFDAQSVYLYNNKLLYMDNTLGNLVFINMGTGLVESQGPEIPDARRGIMLSYVYDKNLYIFIPPLGSNTTITVYALNLETGNVVFTKTTPYGYYKNPKVIGKNIYLVQQFYSSNDEAKIMVLNAENLNKKDSIFIPRQQILNLSILSKADILY